jgi:hypothetical protein
MSDPGSVACRLVQALLLVRATHSTDTVEDALDAWDAIADSENRFLDDEDRHLAQYLTMLVSDFAFRIHGADGVQQIAAVLDWVATHEMDALLAPVLRQLHDEAP